MAGTIVANTINTDTGLFSTNNAYKGIAKAWINFTTSGGVSSINSSFNVSSLTRTATGAYTIAFATAMPDANYAVAAAVGGPSNSGYTWDGNQTNTTTAYNFLTGYVVNLGGGIGAFDYPKNYVLILGN